MKATYLLSFLGGAAVMLGFSTLRGSNWQAVTLSMFQSRARSQKSSRKPLLLRTD
jgi:hypothetical protein